MFHAPATPPKVQKVQKVQKVIMPVKAGQGQHPIQVIISLCVDFSFDFLNYIKVVSSKISIFTDSSFIYVTGFPFF